MEHSIGSCDAIESFKCPKGTLIGPETDVCANLRKGRAYHDTCDIICYIDKLEKDGVDWKRAYEMDKEWVATWSNCEKR
jgi:hypothetical protein